jgi:hypothetical protein
MQGLCIIENASSSTTACVGHYSLKTALSFFSTGAAAARVGGGGVEKRVIRLIAAS